MARNLRECGWLALDGFDSWAHARGVARQMRGKFLGIKVHALEYGEASPWHIIGDLQELGYRVWVDDKQNDIPSAVARAVQNLAKGGADLVSVHAGDRIDTLIEAVTSFEGECARLMPGLGIAVVSVLTSTGTLSTAQVYGKSILERMFEAARWASIAGARVVVCSPREVQMLRQAYPDLTYATPGIRMPGSLKGDHERVGTPAHALSEGAHFLVIGTAVLKTFDGANWNPDMLGAVERIEQSIAYLPCRTAS